ncbi:hypothetical protein Hanom_Chr12g01152811 [Helianthus anomalus]
MEIFGLPKKKHERLLVIYEGKNSFAQGTSRLSSRTKQKIHMTLPFIINNLYIPFPPTFYQNILIIQTPIPQYIFLSNTNKNPGASDIRHFRILTRVNQRVIQPTCSRANKPPYIIN